MEVGEALRRRRTCRSFQDVDVPDELVDAVLEAATSAPRAGNTWSMGVLVLRGADRDAYWEVTLPAGEGRDRFPWPGLLRAPTLLLPYVDPTAYLDRYSDADKAVTSLGVDLDAWAVPYWWVDGGAAVMAVLTAATAAGLGTAFFGQFDHEPAVRDRFGVPRQLRALGTVALGWPAGDDRPSRSALRGRPPLDRLVHHGRW